MMSGVYELHKGFLWQVYIPAPDGVNVNLRDLVRLMKTSGGWGTGGGSGLGDITFSFCAPALKPHPTSDSWEAWKATHSLPDLPF